MDEQESPRGPDYPAACIYIATAGLFALLAKSAHDPQIHGMFSGAGLVFLAFATNRMLSIRGSH